MPFGLAVPSEQLVVVVALVVGLATALAAGPAAALAAALAAGPAAALAAVAPFPAHPEGRLTHSPDSL